MPTTDEIRSFSLGIVGLDLRGLGLEEAFGLADAWGLEHIDLYNGVNYARHEVDDIPQLAQKYGVAVYSVCSRAMPNTSPDRRLDEIALLRETLEHAARVGAAFSEGMVGANHLEEGQARERYAELIYPILARARELGVVLLFENVHHRDGGEDPSASVEGTLALLELINHSHFGLCWDTANFLIHGQTSYGLSYERLRAWIKYVHLKDVRPFSPTQPLEVETTRLMVEPTRGAFVAVPTGRGLVESQSIVRRLVADQFQGPVSVELFCSPERLDWYWTESRRWLESQGLLAAHSQ